MFTNRIQIKYLGISMSKLIYDTYICIRLIMTLVPGFPRVSILHKYEMLLT